MLRNLLVLLAICISTLPVFSEATIRDCGSEFYEIEGESGSDLLQEMKTKNGTKSGHFARTAYTYKINCKTLTTTCNVRMPRWAGRSASQNKQLNAKWDKFYDALIAHEQGHVDIFFNAMKPAQEEIQNMACAKAQKYVGAEFRKQSAAQKAYDAETKHGTLKGASFSGSNYLAMAYSAKSDSVGFAYDQENQGIAKTSATKACKAKDCKFLTWANGEGKCISLAVTPEKAYGYTWADGREESEQKALASCAKYGKGCKIRMTVCAGEGKVSEE